MDRNGYWEKVVSIIKNNTDTVVRIVVFFIATIALFISLLFLFSQNNIGAILAATFSCAVCVYGFYLIFSQID